MFITVIFWLIMLLIAFWQLDRLKKRKNHREIIAFSVLWLIALVYSSLILLDIAIMSPFVLIINLFG